jgi:transcription elongation GreA/GreB family factor
MTPLILLNEAAQSCLHSIIHRTARPPYPDDEQKHRLNDLLASARPPGSEENLLTHVGIGDHTTLVSPLDSQDYYKFRIVMPDEADIDLDHISICTPIAAAVLGRPVGEMVEWQTPVGLRRMRIIAVNKSESLTHSHA